jgi:predicted small metal-binding protein
MMEVGQRRPEEVHMRELRCQDVGMKDCKFVAQGKDDNEVMQKTAQHAKSAHNMATIPPDVEKKARSVIREAR